MFPGGWVRLSVVLWLAVIMGGCGSRDGPQLAPVTGVIKYRGKPLETAQVVFLPDLPGLPLSMGTTDSNGRYELMTDVPGDGATLGRHRVTVKAWGPGDTTPRYERIEGLTVEIEGGLPNISLGPPLVPKKYFNFDTSGLTAEVTEDGVTVDFDLSDE